MKTAYNRNYNKIAYKRADVAKRGHSTFLGRVHTLTPSDATARIMAALIARRD